MLEGDTSYCYLRRSIDEADIDPKAPFGPREKTEENPLMYKRIKEFLTSLQFTETEQDVIWRVLAAIIILGEIEYIENEDGNADIKDASPADKGMLNALKSWTSKLPPC